MKRTFFLFALALLLTTGTSNAVYGQIAKHKWLLNTRAAGRLDIGGVLFFSSNWNVYVSPLFVLNKRWAIGAQLDWGGERFRVAGQERIQTLSIGPVLRHYLPADSSNWAFFAQIDPSFRSAGTWVWTEERWLRTNYGQLSGGIGANRMLGPRMGLELYLQSRYLWFLSQGFPPAGPGNFSLRGSVGMLFILDPTLPNWKDD